MSKLQLFQHCLNVANLIEEFKKLRNSFEDEGMLSLYN
jgi:hypothetical protein